MAIVAGSIWIWRCSMKPRITSAITVSDCLSRRGSVIASRSLKPITCRRFSSVATRWRPQMKYSGTIVATMITRMTGVRASAKSLNVRPVAEPIMMFGGSPISVAVPPMFDAKICANRYGYGLTLSSSVISSVTGTVSSTVVTLSRKAENTAVTIDIISMTPHGLASTFFADQIATYWNRPERRVMLTISIIPSSRPSVLKSTAAIASCWVSTPTRISVPAPSSATMARLSLSLMMTT